MSTYHFKRVVAGMSAVNDDKMDRGSYVKPIIEAEADILCRWLDEDVKGRFDLDHVIERIRIKTFRVTMPPDLAFCSSRYAAADLLRPLLKHLKRGKLEGLFDVADTDGDRMLSANELAAVLQPQVNVTLGEDEVELL